VRARAVSIPAWLWLTAIVAGSILLRVALARRMVAPWIMVDELIYSELAKSLAAHATFQIRGHAAHGFGFLYPILIAPAFRIASVSRAYGVAKAIDSVTMSLAAVPAYLLARRVLQPGLALLVAVLTVAVPSMVYTGTLMTENLFYPVFLFAALALVLVLERPTLPRIALLLALTFVAFLTRTQAVAIAPALLTAPLLLGRRRLREFRLLYALVAGGALLVLAFEVVRGSSPLAVLGAYRVTTSAHYSAGDILKWLVYHVGELDLYVGVAPFAAMIFLLTTRERRTPFAAAAASLTAWLVLEVAAFAATQSQRIEERNMFFVAPFFFIALCWWVERGLPRPRTAAVATVVAAALVGVVPYSGLINGNAAADTLAFLPLWTLQDTVITLDEVAAIAVLGAIVLGAAFLLVPRRWALALPAAVLVWFALTLAAIETNPHGGIHELSLQALFGGTTKLNEPDWIDRTVGRDANVAFLWTGDPERKSSLWENEFFNRSIGPVYDVGPPAPGGLPSTAVHIDPDDGLLVGAKPAQYVLTDTSVPVDGDVAGTDLQRGLVLYRVGGPLRIAYRLDGIEADGWSGADFSVRRFDCARPLKLELRQNTKLFPEPQTVTVDGRRFTVSGSRVVSVHGCDAHFHVSPVRSPGPQDPRLLGLLVSAK
jgi:hypothetical protein